MAPPRIAGSITRSDRYRSVVSLCDLVCGPLTVSGAHRLAASGARLTLWRRAYQDNSKLLTDVQILDVKADVITLRHPDGRQEHVDRCRLFVPSRVMRRLNLDGPLARTLDALSLLPPW